MVRSALAGHVAVVAWLLAALVPAAKAEDNLLEVGGVGAVDLDISGQVSPRCEIGEIADIALPGFNQIGAGGFALSCNAPFTLALSAANGALLNVDYSGPIHPDLTDRADYAVQLSAPLSDGEVLVIETDNSALGAGPVSANSGNRIAFTDARVSVTALSPSNKQLLAGTYIETLTLTISAE